MNLTKYECPTESSAEIMAAYLRRHKKPHVRVGSAVVSLKESETVEEEYNSRWGATVVESLTDYDTAMYLGRRL